MIDIIKEYLAKGWTAPLPLPAGQKHPPPLKTTGNVPHLEQAEIENLWNGRPENSNLALRLQTDRDFDIISLDVDHYGNKRGASFLAEMERDLGPLNLREVPRSTRRGVSSPSGQWFFKVPAGYKWKSDACADVDIVQMTHRYAAVFPSVVDGEQYTWYLGDDKIDIPSVDDLPELPERWTNFLRKSSVGKLVKNRKRNITGRDGYRSAINWLRENIPGWDNNENMSQSLKKVSDSQDFLDNLAGNGHDSMVSAVHAAVMLGVEGHIGLKAALFKIEANFINEVTLRAEKPRTDAEARKEFKSAVIGEVDRLMADVADGNVTITEFSADLALPGFHDLLVRSEADKRPKDVDLADYPNTDLGHAQMMRDYWSKDVLTVAGGDSNQEFAVWTPSTGRFEFRDKRRMFGFMEPAISDRILYEADKIGEIASALEAIESKRQLREDEQDPEELRAMQANLKKRAEFVQATNKKKAILEQMHGFDEYNVNIDIFDSSPDIIGLKGGEVLDLLSLRLGDEFVRKSRQSDLLTKSTAVHLVPEATSDAWEDFLDDFLPDPELRAFTQKALGYSLVSGNPDKKIIFLFGPSNTGKTTILEAVARALGDYAGPMNAIKLFGSNSGGPAPEMVESLNKRMVFMSEVGDDHHLSANSVKRVTGNDSQHTRQLHSNFMRTAAPKFTPYVSTNSVPDIRGVDNATKERIMVIPFEEVHPPKRITEDKDLKSDHNSAAILWWVVEGCLRYYEEGIQVDTWPDRVKDASGIFSESTSPLQEFIADTLEKTDSQKDRVPIEELFGAWENWCIRNRVDKALVGSQADFRKRLAGNGWDIWRGSYNGKRNIYMVRYAKKA